METLPKVLIHYINDFLDPISYIRFLDTGSYVPNDTKYLYNKKQYKNKQIEYFLNKGIDITDTTLLSFSDKSSYVFIFPGKYLIIGTNSNSIKLDISCDNLDINLNAKFLTLEKTLNIIGNNIKIYNGSIKTDNVSTMIIDNSSFINISHIHFFLIYRKTSNPKDDVSCLHISSSSSDINIMECSTNIEPIEE